MFRARSLITTRMSLPLSLNDGDINSLTMLRSWEASAALHKRLQEAGLILQGAPGGWREVYRVFKECKVLRPRVLCELGLIMMTVR